jgi:hypothetical protein
MDDNGYTIKVNCPQGSCDQAVKFPINELIDVTVITHELVQVFFPKKQLKFPQSNYIDIHWRTTFMSGKFP